MKVITKETLAKVLQGETKTLELVEKRANVVTVKDFHGKIFQGVISSQDRIVLVEAE